MAAFMMSSSEEIETKPDLSMMFDFEETRVKSEPIDIVDEMFCEEGVYESAITTVTNIAPQNFDDAKYEFDQFEGQKLECDEFKDEELEDEKSEDEILKVQKSNNSGSSYKIFECLVCNVDFIRKGNLVNHMIKCHTKVKSSVRSKNVAKTYSRRNALKQETKKKEESKKGKETNTETNDSNLKTHNVQRKICCLDCGNKFDNQDSLDKHECITNTLTATGQLGESDGELDGDPHNRINLEKYDCLDCGKNFNSQTVLDKHNCIYFSKVSGQDISKNIFARNNRHIQTGPKKIKCLNCGRGFSHQSSLLRHQRTHTLSTLYQCHLCGVIKYRKDNLQAHIHSHLGHKSYECQVCHHKFTIKSNLNKHMELHHSRLTKLMGVTEGPDTLQFMNIHKGPDGLKFMDIHKSPDNLGVMNIYQSKENRTCSKCGKTFKRPGNLARHNCYIKSLVD